MVSTIDRIDQSPVAAATRIHYGLIVAAVVISGSLFFFGTGLTPMPLLTWLAPLPVFVVALRGSAWLTGVTAFLGWLLGSLNLWQYYVRDIELPVPVTAGFLLVGALVFAGVAVLLRLLLRRGWRVLATLAPAAAFAGAEYLVSLVSPAGAFTSIGYTQADVPVVPQIASLTGVWGISALLIAAPAAAVAVAAGPRRVTTVVTAVLLLSLTVAYGGWRLSRPAEGPTIGVALVDVPQTVDGLAWASPEADQVLARYLAQLPAAARDGASVVVLPEKVFRVDPTELTTLGQTLTAAAAPYRLTVVIGLTLRDATGAHNIAMAYSTAGAVRYDKQHLVPGLEDHFTAGHATVLVPGTVLGLTVCKDLDYTTVGRAYANAGARLLLVPALDFDDDGWLHSRIAITRGVESGVAVARAADRGRLTATDARGHQYAETGTNAAEVSYVSARLPIGPGDTPYDRFGDWFAWLCVALTGGCLILAAVRAPRRGPGDARPAV